MSSRIAGVLLDRRKVAEGIKAEVRNAFSDNGLRFRQTSPNGSILNIEVYASPEDKFPGLVIKSHDLRSEDGPNLGHVELYVEGLCKPAMKLRSNLSSSMGKLYLLECSKNERKDRCSGCYPIHIGEYPD